jgi:hypothetical protein
MRKRALPGGQHGVFFADRQPVSQQLVRFLRHGKPSKADFNTSSFFQNAPDQERNPQRK